MHHGDKSHLFDLNFRETATLAFLTVFVFWIGLNPEPFLKVMDTSTTHLLEQLESGRNVTGHGEHHALLNGVGESIKQVLALK
jgi:NADH-quinone oxidoreductase subunit M